MKTFKCLLKDHALALKIISNVDFSKKHVFVFKQSQPPWNKCRASPVVTKGEGTHIDVCIS